MTAPGRALRIVRGPQLLRPRALEVRRDLPLREGVVPAGEQVEARLQQLVGAVRRDARASGGVLRIPDAEIEAVLLAEAGHQLADGVSPGLANDVANEEEFHETATQRASVHTASTRRS